MELFTKLFGSLLVFVYHCFDTGAAGSNLTPVFHNSDFIVYRLPD